MKANRFAATAMIGILMFLLIAVPGCSMKQGPVKIGAAGPFTGDLSKIGLDSLNAIQMAVDEFNEAGGLDGRKVEVVVGDDGGDPAKGNLVADKFISDPNVVGVVGPMNSSVVNAALGAYDKAGLVLISQSATTSDLTDRGFAVMHRICPRDDSQGLAAATFIANELGVRRVYLLDDKSTYGQGLAEEVAKDLEALGVTETKRDQVSDKDKDFSSLITLLKTFDPDLVYMAFANPAQAANLARQMRSAGLEPKLMGGDGCREKDQLIGGGGPAVQGMYVTAIGRDIKEVPEANAFVQKFESKYQGLSIFSGQSYEATKVLLAAIKDAAKSGKVDRPGVLKAVHATSGYKGILGFPMGFDEKGDVVGGEIIVLTVQGGDFAPVKEYKTGDIK
jgi:branched-chain amino acid transport system substrate-binding protein